MCDLEISRIGAPYIYDISNLRVKVAFRTVALVPCLPDRYPSGFTLKSCVQVLCFHVYYTSLASLWQKVKQTLRLCVIKHDDLNIIHGRTETYFEIFLA